MKIAQIVGARPQFIKYFPLSKAIERFQENHKIKLQDILIYTGQHYDYEMSNIFFQDFGVREPDYPLGVGSATHGEQTGQILQKAEEVLMKEKPDVLFVYGDTNSTLGGALAAVKLHIPVAHIEAGLRSYNKFMPEEINRVLTDHSSSLLLCPTKNAVNNLRREGFEIIINEGKLINNPVDFLPYNAALNTPVVCNVGDVMYDVLLSSVEIAGKKSYVLNELNIKPKEYNVLTLHRAENTDNLERLQSLLDFVIETSSDKQIIFPVHPRTRKVLQNLPPEVLKNINMIGPIGYFDMVWLVKNSFLVFTDSGGLQKEAYWLKVPCITLRDETEWIETVKSGWNVLYKNYIGQHNLLDADTLLYGDGSAAEKIIYAVVNTKIIRSDKI
ncbi:MAG: UDP-N-acetyl glucosamine 2-epimerase [Candidatus Zixiibacteriota bacterium]